jgi:hypothetical protein
MVAWIPPVYEELLKETVHVQSASCRARVEERQGDDGQDPDLCGNNPPMKVWPVIRVFGIIEVPVDDVGHLWGSTTNVSPYWGEFLGVW